MVFVQKPKDKGGLGVINLRLQNDALLLQQLHKFYSRQDVPWVNLIWKTYYQNTVPHASREVGSFWWKDVLRLNVLYRGIAKCSLGNGSTVLFWDDLWCSVVLAQAFPNLFQAATNNLGSVLDILNALDLASVFNLPLSHQAYDELHELQNLLSTVTFDPNSKDSWSFIWGNDKYSAKKLYNLAFSSVQAPRTFSWLWKSQCTPRVKIFAWLVLVDRLNTRVMLRRRNFNLQTGVNCELCSSGVEEDADHLLFACPFAARCWHKLQIQWDLSLDIHSRIVQAKNSSSYSFFMELLLIAAWEIWKLRNSVIFEGARPTFHLWTVRFKEQVQLQLLPFKHDRAVSVRVWLASF